MKILDNVAAMQVLKQTIKGKRHPYYERVTGLADKYLILNTGENIEPLLKQFNPREDDQLFDQRKRITKTIVGAVSGKIKGPFEKVTRSNNVTKNLVITEENGEIKLNVLRDKMNNFWGDETLDDYMEQRVLDLSFNDPNAFIVTEQMSINNEVHIYPFEVSSHEAVNYHYTNNRLDFLVVYNGEKYTMYTATFSVVMIPHDEKKQKGVDFGKRVSSLDEAGNGPGQTHIMIEKKKFMVWTVSNECGEIPAIRVGYKRDEMTKGNTYVSPAQKAIPRMEKIIKSDSELDLVVSLHAFPQKLQYAQKCTGDHVNQRRCEGGKDPQTGDTCKKCSGSGFLFHTSAQNALMYEMPTQDELNGGVQPIDLDKLIAYKHPDIAIIEFENKYTRQLEDDCVKDVFISQNFERSNGTATATEITFDVQSIYDTLYPFARKYSAIYKKQIRIAACYLNIQKGLTVVHQYPKDFKFKTTSQLLDDLKKAEDANAPEFFKNELNDEIAEKIFHDNPNALKRYKIKKQHIPFKGKTKEQIEAIIGANRSTKPNIVLWVEFENIMTAVEDDYMKSLLDGDGDISEKPKSFYDLPYQERTELIKLKVDEAIAAKLNENAIGQIEIDDDDEPIIE